MSCWSQTSPAQQQQPDDGFCSSSNDSPPTPTKTSVILELSPSFRLDEEHPGDGDTCSSQLVLPSSIVGRAVVASDNDVSNGFVKDGKMLPYVFEANDEGIRKRSSKILPVCGVCGKRFVCVTTMKRHLVTHTGEKPFSCKVCGKQYTQKGNLRVHERTHRNDRPFECNICHQKFYRKEPMQKHQWRQHGVVHSKMRPSPIAYPGAVSQPPNPPPLPPLQSSDQPAFPSPPMAHSFETDSAMRFQYSKLINGDVGEEDDNGQQSPPPQAHSNSNRKDEADDHVAETVINLSKPLADHVRHPVKLKVKLAQAYQKEIQELREREQEREEGGRELAATPPSNRGEAVECHCRSCGKTFAVVDPYNFRCGSCNVKCVPVPNHVVADPLQCIGCCQVFPHKPALKSHQTCAEKERPFCCCKCSYRFRQRAHLQKHQWRIHRRRMDVDGTARESDGLLQTTTFKTGLEPMTTKLTIQDIINHGVEHGLRPDEFGSSGGATTNKYFSDVLGLELEGCEEEGDGGGNDNQPPAPQPLDLSPTKNQVKSDSPDERKLRNLIASLPFNEEEPGDGSVQVYEQLPENLSLDRDRLQQRENNPLLNQPPLSSTPSSPLVSSAPAWKKARTSMSTEPCFHNGIPPPRTYQSPSSKNHALMRSLLLPVSGADDSDHDKGDFMRRQLLGTQSSNARTV